jgi:AcrR family transcriptional regulator
VKPTKGERTRERLKKATRRVLARRGYGEMRVTDITRAAGLSQGALYPYFRNKREIALEVLSDLVAETRDAMLSAPRSDDPFDEIHVPTRVYVEILFANAPLVRALLQAADEDEEFARLWQETSHEYLGRVAAAIERKCGSPGVDVSTRLLVAYAVNWMVDGFLHGMLGRADPHQEALVRSPEHLAELLSVLWYRAVYATNPRAECLSLTRDLLDLRLAPDAMPRPTPEEARWKARPDRSRR